MKSMDKGKDFERVVAKALTAWCGITLGRVPMSGAGVFRKSDIWPIDTTIDWPLVVECKKEEGWTFDQLFMPDSGPIVDWLEQVELERIATMEMTHGHYLPMLVFSRNRRPVYTALRLKHVEYLPNAHLVFKPMGSNVWSATHSYVIMKLCDFVVSNPYPEFLRSALELE